MHLSILIALVTFLSPTTALLKAGKSLAPRKPERSIVQPTYPVGRYLNTCKIPTSRLRSTIAHANKFSKEENEKFRKDLNDIINSAEKEEQSIMEKKIKSYGFSDEAKNTLEFKPNHEEPYNKEIVEKLFVNIKEYGLGVEMSTRWDWNERDDCPFSFKFVSHAKYNVLLFDRRALSGTAEINVEFAQNYEFINAVAEDEIDMVCYLKAFDTFYKDLGAVIDMTKPFIVAGQKLTDDASTAQESVLASLLAVDLKRRGHTVDLFIFSGTKKVNVKYFILLDETLPMDHYPTTLEMLRRQTDEHLMITLNESFRTAFFWRIWFKLATKENIPQLLLLPWDMFVNTGRGLDSLGTIACSGWLRAIQRFQRFLDETEPTKRG